MADIFKVCPLPVLLGVFLSSGVAVASSELAGPVSPRPAHARTVQGAGLFPSAVPGAANMETLYRVPFLVLECPNLKLKKPPWVHMPSAMTVYALVVVSYFLITGGNWGAGRGGRLSSGMAELGVPVVGVRGLWGLRPRPHCLARRLPRILWSWECESGLFLSPPLVPWWSMAYCTLLVKGPWAGLRWPALLFGVLFLSTVSCNLGKALTSLSLSVWGSLLHSLP